MGLGHIERGQRGWGTARHGTGQDGTAKHCTAQLGSARLGVRAVSAAGSSPQGGSNLGQKVARHSFRAEHPSSGRGGSARFGPALLVSPRGR